MSKRKRLTPWARIVRAGRRGTGLRLSEADVAQLMSDDAIVARGEADLNGNVEGDRDGG